MIRSLELNGSLKLSSDNPGSPEMDTGTRPNPQRRVSKPGQNISWHKVASHIPGRSNKDCRKRWHYKIAHHFKQGPWTTEEDDKLRRAVLMHGTKWTKVSEEVVTRNGDQCWKRWHDNLDPQIDHSPWTTEEDAVLLRMVHEVGRNWRDIVNKNFPNRTPLSAKNRYGLLQRRQLDNVDYCSSPDVKPSFTSTSSTPPSSRPQSGLRTVPTPPGELAGTLNMTTGTQLPAINNRFAFDPSRDFTSTSMNAQGINASSAVLDGSTFWPMNTPAANHELTRQFLDNIPSQSDATLPTTDLETTHNGIPQENKVLHVTVSCNPARLEEVMHNISRNMSEMMITGGVQRVQYSVE